jgi:hypothetical protein
VRAAATASRKLVRRDDEVEHDLRGGVFTISGLSGLKIDKDGKISGHIRTGVTATAVFTVTVTYTEGGVTATQSIAWTVKPAPSRRGKN